MKTKSSNCLIMCLKNKGKEKRGIYSEICSITLCVLQILGFSVLSIILTNLFGKTSLLARVEKIMLYDL